MVSQILDELFMDLPSELIAKLEVYTFGNAASHFNNPLRRAVNSTGEYAATLSPSEPTSLAASISEIPAADSPTAMVSPMTPLPSSSQRAAYSAAHRSINATPSTGSSLAQSRNFTISPYLPHRVIPHIEHYCNSEDMVTRWGVLYSVKNVLGNRFCGHVFIHEGASGHMLNQHYLAKMFPIDDDLPAAAAAVTAATRRSVDSEVASFLDSIVEVDSATVAKRDGDAEARLKVSRQNSLPLDASYCYSQFHTSSISEKRDRWISSQPGFEGLRTGEGAELKELDLAGAEGSRITVARARGAEAEEGGGGGVEQSRGSLRRVRDLSRLWRYMGGECPLD